MVASMPDTPGSTAERGWPPSLQYTVPPNIARSRAPEPSAASVRARRPGDFTTTPSPGALTATVPSVASRIAGVHSQHATFMNETPRRRIMSTTDTCADGPPSPSVCE